MSRYDLVAWALPAARRVQPPAGTRSKVMHYKNGREARVGDRVVGRCYNTKGTVAGTLMSATPGQDSCNALVGWVEVVPVDGKHAAELQMQRDVLRCQGTQQHGGDGPIALTVFRCDYTACGELLHLDDVAAA